MAEQAVVNPTHLLFVSREFAASSPQGRTIASLHENLRQRNIKCINVHTNADAQTFIRKDPSIHCVVLDWDVDTTRAAETVDVLRKHSKQVPLFLLTEVGNASRIPTDTLSKATDFMFLLEDTANFITGRILAAINTYKQNLLPPLFKALKKFGEVYEYSWHTPGHTGGTAFLKSAVGREFFDYFGENMLRSDLSISVEDLGSLLDHSGPIGKSEEFAAKVFGADRTYYVTNGSSTSNRVILGASVTKGNITLIDRNCHKSLEAAMCLTGAVPVYMVPTRNHYGLIGPIPLLSMSPEAIKQTISRSPLTTRATSLNPVHAVITNSTYDGFCYNIPQVIAALGKSVDRLHFDEAWYAYARFHPIYIHRFAMFDLKEAKNHALKHRRRHTSKTTTSATAPAAPPAITFNNAASAAAASHTSGGGNVPPSATRRGSASKTATSTTLPVSPLLEDKVPDQVLVDPESASVSTEVLPTLPALSLAAAATAVACQNIIELSTGPDSIIVPPPVSDSNAMEVNSCDPSEPNYIGPTIFATQSTHKLLAALSQASMIHVRDGRRPIAHDLFNESFMMHASTSPNYAILASLDVSAGMMQGPRGRMMLDECLREAVSFRQLVDKVQCEHKAKNDWFFGCFQPPSYPAERLTQLHAKYRIDSPSQPTKDLIGQNIPIHKVSHRLLCRAPECWTLEPAADWHGFPDLTHDYCLVDPIKVSILTPGVTTSRSKTKIAIPAQIVTKFLAKRGIVVEKTTDHTFLLLFSIGLTRGKWGTLLSALFEFKRFYDKNESLRSVLPELVDEHPHVYEGLGLRDLCNKMHAKLQMTTASATLAFNGLPLPVFTPNEAYTQLVSGFTELVKLNDILPQQFVFDEEFVPNNLTRGASSAISLSRALSSTNSAPVHPSSSSLLPLISSQPATPNVPTNLASMVIDELAACTNVDMYNDGTTSAAVSQQQQEDRDKQSIFAPSRSRIAAVALVPYPPGIPLIMPGERLEYQALQYLHHIQAFDKAFPSFSHEIHGITVDQDGDFQLRVLTQNPTETHNSVPI